MGTRSALDRLEADNWSALAESQRRELCLVSQQQEHQQQRVHLNSEEAAAREHLTIEEVCVELSNVSHHHLPVESAARVGVGGSFEPLCSLRVGDKPYPCKELVLRRLVVQGAGKVPFQLTAGNQLDSGIWCIALHLKS